MPGATHLLHKEQPYIRTEQELRAYLEATFPDHKDGIRITGVCDDNNQLMPGWTGIGVYGAFGVGKTYDDAVAHLMADEMIHAYYKP